MAVVVPTTPEEVAWFTAHIKEQLNEVKTFTQLSELWTFNAPSVKALPDDLKLEVIAAKDEAKARVKK
jgi:hypothetical protein